MTDPLPPALEFVATFHILVCTPIDLEPGIRGHRRLIPILGGVIDGPLMQGIVIPGGQDNQVLWSATETELHAQYALRLNDGAMVYVDNLGVRTGSESDMQALARGEYVDPTQIYFRTTPKMSSSSPKWAWLSSSLFLGVGIREPDSVRLDVYLVK